MSTFVATPSMAEFMLSDAFVRVIAGPIGSGKSVCCTHELLRWACGQAPNSEGVRKTRMGIIRNTLDQLRSTTLKTVFDWVPPGKMGEWKATEKTLYLRFQLPDETWVESEWMALPMDTPDDVRKALSLEFTGIWGNEARELHPDVVEALLSRVDRYPSGKDGGATRAGAIFDTNYPDIDTYWHKQMETPPSNWGIFRQPPAVITLEEYLDLYHEEPPKERMAEAYDGTVYVTNPAGDNYKHLSKKYYPNNVPGRKQDFLDVYLRCKYGRSLNGTPVYDKTFVPDFHIAKSKLTPIRGESYPLVIGLDFGRTPAAVIGQMDHRGRTLLFAELVSENMGIEKFLSTRLKPMLFEKFPGHSYLIAPDPAGWQKSQVGETCPVDIVREQGFKVKRPVTNSTEPRIQAVESLLTMQIDGEAGFLVDAEGCPELVKGFKYGYRWKLDKKGQLQDNAPDKNAFSHVHDACQYFALVVGGGHAGMQMNQRREIVKVSAGGWT